MLAHKGSQRQNPDPHVPKMATSEDLQSTINIQTQEAFRTHQHISGNGSIYFTSAQTECTLSSLYAYWEAKLQ